MPATLDERRLVRKDRGIEAGNEPTWFVSGDEQRAVKKKLLIRRDSASGEVAWFDVPDRDATIDDLVDPHGCLAFEVGVLLGICACLVKDDLHEFEKSITTRPDPSELCAQIREESNYTPRKGKVQADTWEALSFDLIRTSDLNSAKFRYSKAFEPIAVETFFSLVLPLGSLGMRRALENCKQIVRLVGVLITNRYVPAVQLGLMSVRQRWDRFELVPAKPGIKPSRIRCPNTYNELSPLCLSRQCRAACSFLTSLNASDYLTLSESVARLDGPAWTPQNRPLIESQLFPDGCLDPELQMKRTRGRPSTKQDIKPLLREFRDKHPGISSKNFRKALLQEFAGLSDFITTDDVSNFFRRIKEPAAARREIPVLWRDSSTAVGMNSLLAEIHSECWPGIRQVPGGMYLVPRKS